jgi:hypothetical protein
MEALHKKYLYSISAEVWQIVCDGVDFLDDDEQPTPDQLQKIHRNAQAISILTSSIDMEEFNRVNGFGCGQGCLDNTSEGP